MNRLLLLLIIFIVTGCASMSSETSQKASSILKGNCAQYFFSGTYSQANQLTENITMAYADDGSNYACGFAAIHEVNDDNWIASKEKSSWPRAETLAISRCENPQRGGVAEIYRMHHGYRSSSNINARCRIFARNYEIIWDKESDEKPGLQ